MKKILVSAGRISVIAAFVVVAAGMAIMFGDSAATAQQKRTPSDKSPAAEAHCKFADGKTIDVSYSSPRVNGRKIHGTDGLNPDGQVWRAGAQEATTFEPNTDVVVGGKDVPAGSYTIFVIPNQDKWTFIVSKKTGEWGIPYPGQQFDLIRTDEMKPSALTNHVENFTISFDSKGKTCTLNMDWAETRASIKIDEK
ncbi:MAG TPA: DUF2911 domain-containing protein [Candidatus Acidoferrales bacterium]|nr:DUF2911 domain-containing protein [Candidatus Acidoferrales bacterium]